VEAGLCPAPVAFTLNIELMQVIKKIPNAIDKHVGKRLRMRRQTLGMSQRRLGAALGLKFQQIQNYEMARNRIGSSRLYQLAAILQVTPEFFFKNSPKLEAEGSRRKVTPSPKPLIHFLATPDGIALARAFLRMDMKLRRRVVALVQTLTEAS
jgi:transcriptional regulator with XRE-family HTH domain